MKYEKPNIAVIASAVEAVKGTGKGDSIPVDGAPLFQHVTEAAYEADE
jgi:hypothetical protein